MGLADNFENYWRVLLASVAAVVWLVRLEGKTLGNEKRIDHLDAQVNSLESGLVKELSEVKQALARIEGYLKGLQEKGG